jgi:hypothetical protein
MAQFPNPSTQFKPGQSGNPGGIPSATHRIIKENADKAARIQAMLLDGIESELNDASPAMRAAMLRADINKIIGDALDRELGKATQPIDSTSSDGTMTPTVINVVPVGVKPENKPT